MTKKQDDLYRDTPQAIHESVHAVKNAQQAIELARENQLERTISITVQRTKDALLESLKEVFGEGDNKDPEQMKILVRRIPILCTNIETMHQDISDIKESQRWAVRLVVGGMLTIVTSVIISFFVTFITK